MTGVGDALFTLASFISASPHLVIAIQEPRYSRHRLQILLLLVWLPE